MKTYLNVLAGITSALLGWNIGHLFLTDFGLLKLLNEEEIVLFPCVAISLAIGSVANEIFVSNPTRPKMSLRILPIPLILAFSVGLLSGLVAGSIFQIPFPSQIKNQPAIVRILGWLLVGSSVGLAEGLSWRWHSLEAGNPKRFRQRLTQSIFAASMASLVAAGVFELVRLQGTMSATFKSYEDPLGFAILGLCLGIAFSIANVSPSYLPALRAGSGFEYAGEDYQDIDPKKTVLSKGYPRIDRPFLKFVSCRSKYEYDDDEIEEGLSIELPSKGTIRIGSAPKAHICLPHLPLHVADIQIKGKDKKAVLVPNQRCYQDIAINGTRLGSRRNVDLKHNHALTFYIDTDEDNTEIPKRYRLVFYNRFFDPMA